MRGLIYLFCALFIAAAFADEKPADDDNKLLNNLSIIAVPIGEKGMIIKDDKGCMWVLKNADLAPQLIAVVGEETKSHLCTKKP